MKYAHTRRPSLGLVLVLVLVLLLALLQLSMCPTSARSLYLSVGRCLPLSLCVYFHISFNLSNSRVRRVSIYSLSLCSTGGAFAAGSFCSPQPLATWLPTSSFPTTLIPSAPLTGDYFDRVRLAYLWSQRSGHWKDTDAHTHTHKRVRRLWHGHRHMTPVPFTACPVPQRLFVYFCIKNQALEITSFPVSAKRRKRTGNGNK